MVDTKKLQAVIFDLDGVLIDSVSISHEAKKVFLAEQGIDLADVPDPHGEEHKGGSLRQLLENVKKHLPEFRIDEEQASAILRPRIREAFKKRGITAEPSLLRLLKELRAHQVICAVATSGVKSSVHHKISILGIADYFAVVVTADDVEEHKPSPESYLLAMQRIHVKPGNCIIFEDSTAGIMAGNAAGGTVVGFTGFNPQKTPLANTVKTIDSWDEVDYGQLVGLVATEQSEL
jgi:HAD superfamily hydrolase (TIGR01509 family)